MSPCTVLVMRALATTLPASCLRRRGVGDQIDKARVHPLERGGLRIGDVARDVFERERLRPHPRDRGRECTEDTHDMISNCAGPRPAPFGTAVASRVPTEKSVKSTCYIEGASPRPGKARRCRQFLPGAKARAPARNPGLATLAPRLPANVASRGRAQSSARCAAPPASVDRAERRELEVALLCRGRRVGLDWRGASW